MLKIAEIWSSLSCGGPRDRATVLGPRDRKTSRRASTYPKDGHHRTITAVAIAAMVLAVSLAPAAIFRQLPTGITIDMSKSMTGFSAAQYERAAALIDSPQTLFSKAGYVPLWTAEPGKSDARMPKGCKVVPHDARLWESWFRHTLKNQGRVLSTADVLAIRDNVGWAVSKDPRTQFHPPQRIRDVAATVERVRRETLVALGVTSPSSVLNQVTMADAAWAWAKSQRTYGFETTERYYDKLRRWPTADECLRTASSVDCMMSAVIMVPLLREMDFLGGRSGLQVGGIPGDNHVIVGISLLLDDGRHAKMYHDPTADPGLFARDDSVVTLAGRGGSAGFVGPMGQASIEMLAGSFNTGVYPDDPRHMGKSNADGTYPLGENWPIFNLGNFVPYKLTKYGAVLSKSWVDPNQGWRPFYAYRKNHGKEIDALQVTIETEIRKSVRG